MNKIKYSQYILISLLLSIPTVADSRSIKVSEFEWTYSVEAWEAAANPSIRIAGNDVSRDKHKWATFAGKSPFECVYEGPVLAARNPVPVQDLPVETPNTWPGLSNLNFFINIRAFLNFQPGVIDSVVNRLDLVSIKTATFILRWTSIFKKTGGSLSFTAPVNPPVPVPINVPNFNVSLDEDMYGQNLGVIEVGCCTWPKNLEDVNELDTIINPKVESEELVINDMLLPPADNSRRQVTRYLNDNKVDWYAAPAISPHPRFTGSNTVWEGTNLKDCEYDVLYVEEPGGDRKYKKKKK